MFRLDRSDDIRLARVHRLGETCSELLLLVLDRHPESIVARFVASRLFGSTRAPDREGPAQDSPPRRQGRSRPQGGAGTTVNRVAAPASVWDRIYLVVSPDDARDRIKGALSSGRLAQSDLWLRIQVAPTTTGCVVELANAEWPMVMRLALWGCLPLVALFVLAAFVAGVILGSQDLTLLGLGVFLLAFEGMLLGQAPVTRMIARDALRTLFPSRERTQPADVTGPRTTLMRHR